MPSGFYEPTGKYGLLHQLESIIDLYEQDRESYWSEKVDESSYGLDSLIYEQVDKFTQAVLKHTAELVETEQLDANLQDIDLELKEASTHYEDFVHELNRIVKSDQPVEEIRKQCVNLLREAPPKFPDEDENGLLRMIGEKLCASLAWEAMNIVEDGTRRILKLYILVIKTAPSKTTQSFLSRLSRCFVWGFDPECIILCRSAIDAAFRDVVDDEICRKYEILPRSYEFTLSSRIQAAFKEGIIDNRIRNAAYRVKNRGDKAVHYQPDLGEDVWQVIRDTLSVLQRITKQQPQG